MSILIAASQKDPASMNIAERLIRNHDFKETEEIYCGKRILRHNEILLVQLDVDGVYARSLDRDFDVETIIFISRHMSESGQRSLTVHTTGNPTGSAVYGGRPKSLAWVDPQRMKAALATLKQKVEDMRLSEYSVSLEATHHGPTEMKAPVMFVEIGSSLEYWNDRLAGEAAASAAFSAATTRLEGRASVGFGGGHYPSKHTEADMKGEFAIGHILPKYFFKEFTPEIVELTFKRTIGDCRTAIIDWKGIPGRERSELIEILEKDETEIVKV